MFATALTAALDGIEARLVQVEADRQRIPEVSDVGTARLLRQGERGPDTSGPAQLQLPDVVRLGQRKFT